MVHLYNLVASESDKFSDAQNDNFQAEILSLLQKYK